MSDKKIVVPWKGKTLKTYSEMWGAAIAIKDPKEAKKLVAAYEKAGMKSEIFLSNLGYWAGYYGVKERTQVLEVFGAVHPVFGDNMNPTPEEALEAGKRMGERQKAKR